MKEESDKLHISTDEQIELSRKVDWGYQEKKNPLTPEFLLKDSMTVSPVIRGRKWNSLCLE